MDDSEKLILTIKKEESVWNIHSEDFLHRQLKVQAWRRICQKLTHDWSELSPKDQEKAVAAVKKRWSHVKDYYKREKLLKKQYFSKRKSQIVNRRKYVFNDLLGFLDPTISVTKRDFAERLKRKTQLSSFVDNESSSSVATEESMQNVQNIQSMTIDIVNAFPIKSELSEGDEVISPPQRRSSTTNEDFMIENEQQSENSLPQSSPKSNLTTLQCSMNTIPQPHDQLIIQTAQPRRDESEELMINDLSQRVHDHQITLNPPQRQNASERVITFTPQSKESVLNNFAQIAQPMQSGAGYMMHHTPQLTRERLSETLERQESSQMQATPSYLGANPNVAFLLSCVQEMEEMSSFQRIEFKSGVMNLLKTIKYPS